MASEVKAGITLRTARGVFEGVLRELGEDVLVVEGEHGLRPGAEVEFQFALPGAHANLYGRARIERLLRLALSPTRTELTVTDMGREQRGLLREWLGERLRGESPAAPRRPAPSVEEMRRARAGEEISQVSSPSGPSGGNARTGSLVSSLSDRPPPRARDALRDTLTAYPRPEDGEHPQAAGRRRADGERGADPSARALRRIDVKLAQTATPPILHVRYNDPQRYREHYWKHLQQDVLKVRFDDAALTAGTEIRVSLVLPGGAIIRCIGHVTTATGQGFALKLDLDAAARTLMRASAGRPMSPK
jgi:hypothetical protein